MEYCTRCKKDTPHSGKLPPNGNGEKTCDVCGNRKFFIQGFNADLM